MIRSDVSSHSCREKLPNRGFAQVSHSPLCVAQKEHCPFIRHWLLTARCEAPVIAERRSKALTYTLLMSGQLLVAAEAWNNHVAQTTARHTALRCEYGDQIIFLRTWIIQRKQKMQEPNSRAWSTVNLHFAAFAYIFFYTASLFFTLICYFAFKTRTQLHPIKVPNYANSDHACDFFERLRRF